MVEAPVAALAAVLAVFIVLLYFTRYYYRDILFGPPVDFDGDRYIEIGLYPRDYRAAVILTCDDVNALTEPQKVERLLAAVDKYGLKTVFFVIPLFKGHYNIAQGNMLVNVLKEAEKRGHEVALHGLTHTSPTRKFLFFRKSRELGALPYSEQKRRITKGTRLMEAAGFSVAGFRSPAFSSSIDTMRVLDSEEFLYASDTRVRPILLMSNKRFCESIYYPYHPRGLGILDFTNNGDYFWGYPKLGSENLRALMHRFKRFYEHQGTFVLLSHIEPVNSTSGMKTLEKFLRHIKDKNVWMPNLRELAQWWLAREALFAVSEVEGKTLQVNLEKGSELPLRGLTIRFKDSAAADSYRISANGTLLKKGKISEGKVFIDV